MQVKDPLNVLCLTTSNFGKLWVLNFGSLCANARPVTRVVLRELNTQNSSNTKLLAFTFIDTFCQNKEHAYINNYIWYMIHDTCHACLTWESFFEFLCRFYIHTIECISSNLTFTLGLIPKDRCDWVSAHFKKRKFGFFILGSNFKITH